MAKFRKKPIEIEAVQYKGDENLNEIQEFCGEQTPICHAGNQILGVQMLDGIMNVPPGTWITKDVKGELDACGPELFEETYEAIE
jgi:hypothetical protein